jgi:hypothetical protein
MSLFIKKLIWFFVPFVVIAVLIVGSFFYLDPFRILNKQDVFNNYIVAYNEDFVTTERYLKQKDRLNAFIFGSSRAGCGFQLDAWAKHLDSTDKAYSFCASNESIFGIYGKMRLIDEEGKRIDKALIVIDTDVTFTRNTNSMGHLFIKHPRVSGESRKEFVSEFIKDYIFTGFFVAYLDYHFFHTRRSYMDGYLDFNLQADDEYIPFNVKRREGLILADSGNYYLNKTDIFYARPAKEVVQEPKISKQGLDFLNKIKKILDKHQTEFKVIVSPIYDQKKLNPADIDVLKATFGGSRVYDFSGKNEITDSIHNYYEAAHFRIHIGEQIINQIYQNEQR